MATGNEVIIDGKIFRVSNLEKVFFPKVGFTKAHVMDYYLRIAPTILPHLQDRPVTLKRYPEGVEGEFFYEKECPRHHPSWVRTAEVLREDQRSKIHFCLLNDRASLVWVANLADIEMHVLLAKASDVQCPTMIVFDLDPGAPAQLLECTQVALWLKEALDQLHLESFVKTSGSKGLQVYVPLNTPTRYEVTKPFAKSIAELLQKRHPEKIVAKMSKALRKGKVFIDWSQNDDHKTTVCVYSLRAKERPWVSAPLTWEEVQNALKRRNADHLAFDSEQIFERLKRFGDLFQPLLDLKQTVPLLPGLPPSKPLESYRARRNFRKTDEPVGKKSKAPNAEGLFVIQKHAASHLHYDLRLQINGVLKSWAVPKGIPTQKGKMHLAMHVEDHPLEYARFEGIIPEGQYGGGTVMVWDIGTYAVKGENPAESLNRGKLNLTLDGKKLKGTWTLFKARSPGEENRRWFLLKTGGDIPPFSPRVDDRSALTRRTMARIASNRDAQWESHR